MIVKNGKIPMRWWDYTTNFGDLLGPWLVNKMTGYEPLWVPKNEPHYVTVGSILGHVQASSIVWGTGSFGSEGNADIASGDRYLAVRGPLTRARLQMYKQDCEKIYGDPALLVPDYYPRRKEPDVEVGVVLRWSERKRKRALAAKGIPVIDLETDRIEDTLDNILSCKRIISTSLHGLILADAYNIPNSWLLAETGYGKEHKFWDYLLSVRKEREPDELDSNDESLTLENIASRVTFDERPIQLDLDLLRESSPFWNSSECVKKAESAAFQGSERMIKSGLPKDTGPVPRYLLKKGK